MLPLTTQSHKLTKILRTDSAISSFSVSALRDSCMRNVVGNISGYFGQNLIFSKL